MMLGALVVGVAAATFAIGLNWSLLQVMTDLHRSVASPVRIEAMGPGEVGGKGGGPGNVQVAPGGRAIPARPRPRIPPRSPAAIAGLPDTAHSVAIGQLDVDLPGLAAVPFVGYQGDTGWLGYALIEGRWFSGPGEVVAPTNLFTQTGLHVGDTVTLHAGGHSTTVTLVGEIFDTPRESDDEPRPARDLGGPGDPRSGRPAIALGGAAGRRGRRPGLPLEPSRTRSGSARAVFVEGDSSGDASFLLFLSVVGLLGVVLVAMSIGGVFNTVLLETRQRTREVAVLKAIGLTPAQVVAMVIATVIPVGLLAGIIGVPIGLAAQRLVLGYMGEVAAKTRIPEPVYDVFPLVVLVGLGLLGPRDRRPRRVPAGPARRPREHRPGAPGGVGA